MKMVLAIFVGGGLGALGRYGAGLLALRLFGATRQLALAVGYGEQSQGRRAMVGTAPAMLSSA